MTLMSCLLCSMVFDPRFSAALSLLASAIASARVLSYLAESRSTALPRTPVTRGDLHRKAQTRVREWARRRGSPADTALSRQTVLYHIRRDRRVVTPDSTTAMTCQTVSYHSNQQHGISPDSMRLPTAHLVQVAAPLLSSLVAGSLALPSSPARSGLEQLVLGRRVRQIGRPHEGQGGSAGGPVPKKVEGRAGAHGGSPMEARAEAGVLSAGGRDCEIEVASCLGEEGKRRLKEATGMAWGGET